MSAMMRTVHDYPEASAPMGPLVNAKDGVLQVPVQKRNAMQPLSPQFDHRRYALGPRLDHHWCLA